MQKILPSGRLHGRHTDDAASQYRGHAGTKPFSLEPAPVKSLQVPGASPLLLLAGRGELAPTQMERFPLQRHGAVGTRESVAILLHSASDVARIHASRMLFADWSQKASAYHSHVPGSSQRTRCVMSEQLQPPGLAQKSASSPLPLHHAHPIGAARQMRASWTREQLGVARNEAVSRVGLLRLSGFE